MTAPPVVALGAALPDLASMGRFRLLGRARAGSDLAVGIDAHHTTDARFHRHPWFMDLSRATATALERGGLPRGAARACGHVGVELLIDGRLWREPGVRTASASAFGQLASMLDRDGAEFAALVVPDRRVAWLAHLRRLTTVEPPEDHDDPAVTAGRLFRILADRPRLRFDRGAIPLVATALDRVNPAITAGSVDLVEELADGALQPRH
ncbi:MAG: hypothetical protein ACK5RL_15110 [Acidimicrobiales bacterium]